jgi:hypothetical protein
MLGQTVEGFAGSQITGENLLDNGALRIIQTHATRIARGVWISAIAVGRQSPRQQAPGFEFSQATAPGALDNQASFVFGDRAAHLEQQLVVRVLTHGAVEKFDLATVALQFFQQ